MPDYHVMLKPTGASCNLDCTYCYYKYKNYLYQKPPPYRMSYKLLKKFTIHYLRNRSNSEVVFGWQGGEPTLLGVDFFRKALDLQKKFAPKGVKILNTIQTNGTLLNEEWAKFLKENNFLVGISIDGPKDLHNFYRKDKSGKGSFDKTIRGLKYLQKYDVDYNILACVHKGNQDYPLKVYRFFRDELKAKFIQFIPIVERKRMFIDSDKDIRGLPIKESIPNKRLKRLSEVYQYSVDPVKYGEFLLKIFKEWIIHDVGNVFIQLFDVTLSNLVLGFGGLCAFNKLCGDALVMEYNGDVYSCDHFVDNDHLLGNLMKGSLLDFINDERQIKFGKNKFDRLPQKCLNCPALHLCWGGCPKNRFIRVKGEEEKLNYLCPGYYMFFTKSLPYFEEMANLIRNGKPASEIMKNTSDFFKGLRDY